jgi:SAM-dependent methyltransferase
MGFSLKRKAKKIKRKLVNKLVSESFFIQMRGYCPICEKHVPFTATMTNLRETLDCPICKSVSRERALMQVINQYCSQWRDMYIHESSPGNRGVSRIMKNEGKNYVGSHYYPNQEPGKIIGSYRNENLEEMTFPDNSFDLVITQDVMEHVYNPEAAFKEIARTLKKGGAHIFTIPVANKHKSSEVWATKGKDGKPAFLKDPEYHGNPIDPIGGSPVTMHWGYDIVDFIKEISGMESTVETYTEDFSLGIYNVDIDIFVSVKK